MLKLLNTLTNILANWDKNSYNVARSRISDWLGAPTCAVATVQRAVAPVEQPEQTKTIGTDTEAETKVSAPRVINAQANTGLGLGAK